MKGFLLVISGPTAAGKGTIVKEILKKRDDIVASISVTTRYQRENEIDGVDYFFKTQKEFDELIETNKLLEHAVVHGNSYGTPIAFVEKSINEGKVVILEIDVQGASQVRQNFENAVYIFMLPPKKSDIEARLRHRNTESEEMIQTRLRNAEVELAQIRYYDYFLINDYVDKATKKLEEIIDEELEKRREEC